jgi:vacuolar protein sorting-associated protein 13A/C
MFEGLLEKILANYFGKYISGLDANNLHLGVWNGNIVIENVNLKKEVFDELDFPLKMIFSSVGRLQI